MADLYAEAHARLGKPGETVQMLGTARLRAADAAHPALAARDAGSSMPDAADADQPPADAGRLWFELFNEIAILAQLSRAMFEAAQDDGLTMPQFGVLNHLVRRRRRPVPARPRPRLPDAEGEPDQHARRGSRRAASSRPRRIRATGARSSSTSPPAGRARREAAIASVVPTLARLGARLDPEDVARLLPGLADLRRIFDEDRNR